MDGQIGQHTAVCFRRKEGLGAGRSRNLLRIDDHRLVDGAKLSRGNQLTQARVGRHETQRLQREQRRAGSSLGLGNGVKLLDGDRERRMGDHMLAGAQGFLDSGRLVAVRRSHQDGIYGSLPQERREARKDRHAVPSCRRHAESSAAFGDGYQFRRIVLAQPVEHAVDLIVFQPNGRNAERGICDEVVCDASATKSTFTGHALVWGGLKRLWESGESMPRDVHQEPRQWRCRFPCRSFAPEALWLPVRSALRSQSDSGRPCPRNS